MTSPTEDDIETLTSITMDLTALRYFPETAAPGVAGMLARLVRDIGQARKLVADMIDNFDEWPGPQTLKQRYFQMFCQPGEPDWMKAKAAGIAPEDYTDPEDYENPIQ